MNSKVAATTKRVKILEHVTNQMLSVLNLNSKTNSLKTSTKEEKCNLRIISYWISICMQAESDIN